MSKLEIVSMVKINGVLYKQEEVPKDQFRKLLEAKITDTMQNLGFRKEGSIEPVTKDIKWRIEGFDIKIAVLVDR